MQIETTVEKLYSTYLGQSRVRAEKILRSVPADGTLIIHDCEKLAHDNRMFGYQEITDTIALAKYQRGAGLKLVFASRHNPDRVRDAFARSAVPDFLSLGTLVKKAPAARLANAPPNKP